MALLCNGARLMTNTCRAFSGVTSNAGGGIASLRGNFDNTGAHRCFQSGQHAVSDVTNRSGFPNGYVHKSWLLPQKTGAVTSRRKSFITVAGTAVGAKGRNEAANSTVSINAAASGGLIAGGVAVSTITLSGAAEAFAGLGTTASATITISGTALSYGIAHGDATAEFSITGILTPYGIAWGEATTDFGNTLTPQNLAKAVWDSLAVDSNSVGTMGEKLNDAGSASNPWTEIIEGTYTAADIMKILAAVSAGKTTITDLGSGNATVTFRNLGDTKDRSVFDMVGSERTDRTEDLS